MYIYTQAPVKHVPYELVHDSTMVAHTHTCTHTHTHMYTHIHIQAPLKHVPYELVHDNTMVAPEGPPIDFATMAFAAPEGYFGVLYCVAVCCSS